MSIKDKLIKVIPDSLFAFLWNQFKYPDTNVFIRKSVVNDKLWTIFGDLFYLDSPTAKFTSVGMKQFGDKFCKYFDIESHDCCLDVGACIGDTTVPMLIKTDNIVYSVEPDDTNFKFLLRNTEKYKNCIQINKGVWSSNAIMDLNQHGTPTGHSLIKSELAEYSSTQLTEVVNLDTLLKWVTVDFAKIDVQWAEEEVLKGAFKFMETCSKLCVECHGHGTKHSTKDRVQFIVSQFYPNIEYENGVLYAWK